MDEKDWLTNCRAKYASMLTCEFVWLPRKRSSTFTSGTRWVLRIPFCWPKGFCGENLAKVLQEEGDGGKVVAPSSAHTFLVDGSGHMRKIYPGL